MKNIDLAKAILTQVGQQGVEHIICCAGARNAPFVEVLSHSNFNVEFYYEERGASFYSLGKAVAAKKPVAIITTSGTAVSELLSAVIEAKYSGTPLVVITADRPKPYRGSGAPQAIEQSGIFSQFVENEYDLDVFDEVSLQLSATSPVHINVCFDEPLLDSDEVSLTIEAQEIVEPSEPEVLESIDLATFKNPLVIASGPLPQEVVEQLLKMEAPVIVESNASLNHHPCLINSHELLLRQSDFIETVGSVIRVGRVPTVRFWRDLEAKFKELPVANFSHVSFSGLSRNTCKPESYSTFLKKCSSIQQWSLKSLSQVFKRDKELFAAQQALLDKYPQSEPSLVRQFASQFQFNFGFVGNSLAIRQWDQFSLGQVDFPVFANRGVNGIDGLVATYSGLNSEVSEESNSFCLLGDLSLKYDMNSLELLNRGTGKTKVVVLNNKGGKIFSRIFKNENFENNHDTNFHALAQFFGLKYISTANITEEINDYDFVELTPDLDQTSRFWQEWDNLWKK